MIILITGAKGFIGKNLVCELKNRKYNNIYEYDMDSTFEDLERYVQNADFIYHLAGVNRPEKEEDFLKGNFGFTSDLLSLLKKYNKKTPIMLSSSIQAVLNNPYGISKKAGEDLLINFGKENNSPILIYRFPNVFGKWCRPNYNSAIATFCHNVANDLPITVNDPELMMNLIYIDDLVNELISRLTSYDINKAFYDVSPVYQIKLGDIVKHIYSFKESRDNKFIPNMEDEFVKKLYATYLSYLPTDKFKYELKMNIDHRGSFTEFIKTKERGQVSVNISKPGIVKGNHWHHTKNEKFLVVSGKGVIRFRKIGTNEIIEYYVSGEKLEVIDIPVGYTHNIENLGNEDMVTIMWANEPFDPEKPDTFFEEV